MLLSPTSILVTIEITFFSLVLLTSLYLHVRHGSTNGTALICLALLSILHLAGGACLLVVQGYYGPSSTNSALLTTYYACNVASTAPLVLTLWAFLGQMQVGMRERGIRNAGIWCGLLAVTNLAMVLAILSQALAGLEQFSYFQSAPILGKISAALFLALWLALAVLTVVAHNRKLDVLLSERRILLLCIVALPFLLVRVLYVVLVTFVASEDVYDGLQSVYGQAFAWFATEAVAVVVFLAAGFASLREVVVNEMVEGPGMGRTPEMMGP